MDEDELMKKILEVDKKLGEKEKEEVKAHKTEEYYEKLLKKTGMKDLKEIIIYSPTPAGYRAWLEKGYKGSFEEFLILYRYGIKKYGRWKSF